MKVASEPLTDDNSDATNYGISVMSFINGLENDPFASLSIVQCISDVTNVYSDLKLAVDAIKTNKNVTGLINAIDGLKKARSDLSQQLKSCVLDDKIKKINKDLFELQLKLNIATSPFVAIH